MEDHHHLGVDLEVSEALGQGELEVGEVLLPPPQQLAIPIVTLEVEIQEVLVASAALEALDQGETQEEIQDHLPAPRLPQLLQLQVHPPQALVIRDQDQDSEALVALEEEVLQVLAEEMRGLLRPLELLLPEPLLEQVEPPLEDSEGSEEEALLGLLPEPLLPEPQLQELQLPELLLELLLEQRLGLHLQDQPGQILKVQAAQLEVGSEEVSEDLEVVLQELSEEAQGTQETQVQAAHQPQLQPQ